MTKKEAVEDAKEVSEDNAETAENIAKMAMPVAEKDAKMPMQGEAKMATEMPPMPEVGHIKVGLMAAPGGRQSINIETSDNMSYGLAIEMLESALGRLKSAPLKY